MSVRVRTKQVRDAVKDLTYVMGYIEEWRGEEHVRPIGTHQQRYQLIALLTKFALDKLEGELIRQGGNDAAIDGDSNGDEDGNQHVGQAQSIDNQFEEDQSQENA